MSGPAAALVVVLLVTGMLAMGASLTVANVAAALRRPAVLTVAVTGNLVVLPATAVLLLALLPVPDPAALALLLVAAAPGGGTGALLAFHARGDVAHAVTLQALLAATSLVSVPFWLTAYAGTGSARGLDVGPLVLALLAFQLAPLVVGMALRARSARLAGLTHLIARRVADVALVVLVTLLVLRSGDDVAGSGAPTLIAIVVLVLTSLALGGVPIGPAAVRRATAMTTVVRNLSMALLAATLAAEPDETALVVLGYGLLMYVVALATAVRLRAVRVG